MGDDDIVLALIGKLILVVGSVMADAARLADENRQFVCQCRSSSHERIGITEGNVSLLKSGRVKGVRFEALAKIGDVLACQPADILLYVPDVGES